MKTITRTLIIIPTYNEAENIALLAAQIANALPEAHLLLVDDASPDGTADIATRLFATDAAYKNYRVLRRTGLRGLGRAYREGFDKALAEGYDLIIQMDADLSHDPCHLPELVEATRHADLVIGSRYCLGGGVKNWPWRRILLSRFAVWYVRTLTHVPLADATAGYRCWTRRALESVELETLLSEGYSFQVEMSYRASRAGMRIAEVPILFVDRQYGRSKISRTVLLESIVLPWRLRWRPWVPRRNLLNRLSADNPLEP